MSEKFNPNEQKIEWLPVKNLSVVYTESQRPYIASRARKIADNFDPDRFDPIKVTLPNGNGIYHIVEGQHRAKAVEMQWGPDEKAPCIVIEANDPAEAARHFDGINGLRWRVDPISTFKVRVTAGEPTENAVNKIVLHHGYKIGNGPENDANYISAVAALIYVYTTNGPTVLSDALKILSATWHDDAQRTNGNLLRGYGAFLNEFGSKVNWETLKSSVNKKYTPGNLLTTAKDNKDLQGGTLGDAVARVLFATYNRFAKPDKRLKQRSGK